MTLHKQLLLIIIIPFFGFSAAHQFYVSITQINYIPEKQSVQIISRFFIDDFETALNKQYNNKLILGDEEASETTNSYIKDYLENRMRIKINNQPVSIHYIGKAYEGAIMLCYIEVREVPMIHTFEISNKVLFDIYEDQKNIVRTQINSKQKSEILTQKKQSLLLKFE